MRMLRWTALMSTRPGTVVALGSPEGDEPEGSEAVDGVPLLRDRPLLAGRATAYVCQGHVCDLPTTDPDRLAERVGSRPGAPQE